MTTRRLKDSYDAYHCTKCNDTGKRRNNDWELAGQQPTTDCFCGPWGYVLVLKGFKPPFYAGDRWPEKDVINI